MSTTEAPLPVGYYRKVPLTVRAVQWIPGRNLTECTDFLGLHFGGQPYGADQIAVNTLEGPIYAQPGDWLIEGVHGEHYPCKPDIFAKTYVPAL